MKKDVDKALKMSENELKTALPPLVERVKAFGVGNLMEAMPDLALRLVNNLRSIDVRKFVTEAPEASAAFTDVLWEGVGILVEKDEEVKKKVVNAGEIKVNFEATDSPLKGHFKLSGGKISGGSALLDAPDLKVSSDAKTLIGLLIGDVDPVKGYIAGQFKLEGDLATGIKLVPVMTSLTKRFKA
ncbi:MAG: SCP-2 sterol transfer family protein [Candidatus Bathyarchaeota archaeon BA2]|nr:MAG: SCP-2 sterol transfer family protein [Candidatus Bathyarchaeota archaeon BA2]